MFCPKLNVYRNGFYRVLFKVPQRHEHQMPENLKSVITDKDPEFSNMISYYYHKSAQIMEKSLVKEMDKYLDFKPEEKQARVSAILNLIGSVCTSLEVNFPIIRKDGTYEIVTGYRAHHVRNRLPLKGGKYQAPGA